MLALEPEMSGPWRPGVPALPDWEPLLAMQTMAKVIPVDT